MDPRQRIVDFVKALPAAHRVMIVSALAGLLMAGAVFTKWVTTPSYTVLYSGLSSESVAGTIGELETLGVPYKLDGGGSTVLVPRDSLYETRASLAGAGITGTTTPPGYELLDEQGLSVSDFRQRVDYQRALEGELSKTLMAMDGVDTATVRLVVPEEELFAEDTEPVTASILLGTARPLDESEVETVTFLVSSAVSGLEPDSITVADAKGTVLHAPGDTGGASVVSNRNMRQTREFEQTLAGDITALLAGAGGAPASVVVRAQLNFDESQTQTETYDPDRRVTLKEQTSDETFEGTGAAPGGAVGVDGGPLNQTNGGDSNYDKSDVVREYGVDKVTSTSVAAPGSVEKLSVAVVMDDGTTTGADVLPAGEVTELVSAAVGLDAARGDTIAVSTMALPAPAPAEEEPAPPGPLAIVPQVVGAVVLLLVCLALFLMTRRRKSAADELAYVEEATVDVTDAGPEGSDRRSPQPVVAGLPATPAGTALEREVRELVSGQPEEIATLLRSWLADRRS